MPVIWELGEKERRTIASIVEKITQYKESNNDYVLMVFDTLYLMLSAAEADLVTRIKDLDLIRNDVNLPFLGIEEVPDTIVQISGQCFISQQGHAKIIDTQYLPQDAWDAYQALNGALLKEAGLTLLVESGYRSPAYQMAIFLEYLSREYDYDLASTLRRVALPGYSEHGSPIRQGMDFITAQGLPSDDDPEAFERTKEYEWLVKNSHEYDFSLSYPRGNRSGIMFEPWHWRFQKRIR